MKAQTGIAAKVEVRGWASPRPGMSLDELIAKMESLGNKVLKVDREGNRIQVI